MYLIILESDAKRSEVALVFFGKISIREHANDRLVWVICSVSFALPIHKTMGFKVVIIFVKTSVDVSLQVSNINEIDKDKKVSEK